MLERFIITLQNTIYCVLKTQLTFNSTEMKSKFYSLCHKSSPKGCWTSSVGQRRDLHQRFGLTSLFPPSRRLKNEQAQQTSEARSLLDKNILEKNEEPSRIQPIDCRRENSINVGFSILSWRKTSLLRNQSWIEVTPWRSPQQKIHIIYIAHRWSVVKNICGEFFAKSGSLSLKYSNPGEGPERFTYNNVPKAISPTK
jgi:hypothetical protein